MSFKKFYYDDPEGDALSRTTSHPDFVKHMQADFYYDCMDEFSRFGNDDGSDLLFNLEEWYQQRHGNMLRSFFTFALGKGDIVSWLFATIDTYGFKFESLGCSMILDREELRQLELEDPHFLLCMDNTIIAAAFGQYKISGQLHPELRIRALAAIKRRLLLNQENEGETANEYQEKLLSMRADLEKTE